MGQEELLLLVLVRILLSYLSLLNTMVKITMTMTIYVTPPMKELLMI